MRSSIFNISYWIERWSQLTPKKIAIFEGQKELSYKEFNSRINRLANALKNELKVKKGDRISVCTLNRIEFLEIWFASSKLGAILVPLNFRLAEEELEYMLDDTSPRIIFYDTVFKEKIESLEPESQSVNHLFEIKDEKENDYEKLIGKSRDNELKINAGENDTCIIPYTGGTTGLPKGAKLTHSNITYHSISMCKSVDLTSTDVTLTVLPLFHTGGINLFTAPTLKQGGTLVLQRKFDPESVLETIERKNVNIMFAVPTIYREIMESDKFEQADLSSIRVFMNGGDYCPPEIMKRYHKRDINFIHSYGLTESSPGVLANYYKDEQAHKKSKEGSVGKPLFYSKVKIVDEEGEEVEIGETGELLTKGPHVIKEYWNKPEETEKAFSSGWLHTGDLARKDEEGYYYIEGRKKDMIVSGGENIYLSEIERVLTSHPKVKEAAVIGVPHEKWGEVGKAIIVSENKIKEKEILEHCEGKLAEYKIPKSVVFTDSLPKGPAGSVSKEKLKEKYK